jgi:three-Cys-motif partner protein
MRRQNFRFSYVDAFAGSGQRSLAELEGNSSLDFGDLRQFFAGSPRIALSSEPKFDRYVFIDARRRNVADLERVRADFPAIASRVDIIRADANLFLTRLCEGSDWRRDRALVFLDPYGLQVSWKTLVALAKTKGTDVWYLFPLGVGVNRMLTRDGTIDPSWRARLDEMLGDGAWFEKFYRPSAQQDLFRKDPRMEKFVDFKGIMSYWLARLGSIFPGVASNPLWLVNRMGNPLYALCFACANPKGAATAIKIAQHILSEKR